MTQRKEPGGLEAVVAKRIRDAAERALAEAQARRENATKAAEPRREIDGASGPDPIRYGDWEVKGRAVDF